RGAGAPLAPVPEPAPGRPAGASIRPGDGSAAPSPVPARSAAVAENEAVPLSEFSGLSEPRSGGRRHGAVIRPPGDDEVPARHAWVCGRLLAGLPLNGEVALVSDRHRLFANSLAEAPVKDRQRLWSGFLELLPEPAAGALVAAVAAAEPASPPPEG